MKTKVYSPSSSAYKPRRAPVIAVNKYGQIRFSSTVVEAMEIKGGDKVVFHQDEENLTDWYVQKIREGDGFIIRVHSGKTHIFNSSNLVRRILKSCGIEKIGSYSFPVSLEPTDINDLPAYALITAAVISKQEL